MQTIDLKLEYDILMQIIRPKAELSAGVVDVSGTAAAALFPRPLQNFSRTSREAVAAVMRAAGFRFSQTAYREPEPGDLSLVTQQTRRVTIVTNESPLCELYLKLGVQRPAWLPWLLFDAYDADLLQRELTCQGLVADEIDRHQRLLIEAYAPRLSSAREKVD